MTLVRSETVGLIVAPETSLGTQPTANWLVLQPNPGGIQDFQPNFSTVERDPLSKYMTREKGDNVGLDAAPKFVHDLNKDTIDFFGTSIFRSAAKQSGGTGLSLFRPTAVTGTGFTVAALGAIPNSALFFTRGFTTAANNGLKLAAGTSTGTEIKTTGLVAEASPPSNATLDVVGYQASVAADIQMNASGNLTATALDFTTLGLQVGMWIYLPSSAEALEMGSAAYAFANTAYTGFARITAIAAGVLTLERRTWTVGAADLAVGKTIRFFFTSRWYRNVSIDHADYLEPSCHAELEEPGAGTAGVSAFTYGKGLSLKTFELDAPLESKIQATFSFIGTDIADPVLAASRATGASTALAPQATALLDTSTDLTRVRLATASSDASLAAEINSWKLTIENNVKPRKQQGTFGAAGMIFGKIEPSVSMEAYFLTDEIPKAIRDNRDCTWDAMIRNDQCGMVWDMPKVAIRQGTKTYAANEAVMISLASPAFRDTTTNLVASLSVFGYLP
jgi:hypothetical protein